jgi:hypothetical protein
MNRLLTAHTPLGNVLWAVRVSGDEALSSLYHFTVCFKSASPNIDCQAMIGELCALELETDQHGRRYLSWQMIDFAAIGHEGRHWVYEATDGHAFLGGGESKHICMLALQAVNMIYDSTGLIPPRNLLRATLGNRRSIVSSSLSDFESG